MLIFVYHMKHDFDIKGVLMRFRSRLIGSGLLICYKVWGHHGHIVISDWMSCQSTNDVYHFKIKMSVEMSEQIFTQEDNGRYYNIRKYTRTNGSNSTLIIGSSLLKHITNDKFDTISISGGRVETIMEFLKSMDVEKYIKIGILAGDNNLRTRNAEAGESPMKVVYYLEW